MACRALAALPVRYQSTHCADVFVHAAHAHGAATLRIFIALERQSLALGALTVLGGGALFRDFLASQARCPLSAISVLTTRPFRLDILAFRARTVRTAGLVGGQRGRAVAVFVAFTRLHGLAGGLLVVRTILERRSKLARRTRVARFVDKLACITRGHGGSGDRGGCYGAGSFLCRSCLGGASCG